jgi:hypothetical protein
MLSNHLSSSPRSLPSAKPLVRRGAMLLACCSLFLTLTGCHPSTDQIGDNVKDSMQSTFDKDPNFVNYHFKVDKVVATKKDDTNFDGMATVEYQGQPHQVPIHITLDSKNMADWKTDPGALDFAAQQSSQ